MNATKRARAHARRSDKYAPPSDGFMRLVLDNSPRPILITDADVNIVYVNRAWEKQFGYTLKEVRGQNPRILQSGQTPRRVYQKMWKALRTGKTFRSDEVIDRRKNGTLFNLFTTTFPMKAGRSLYYVQILDDITKAKRIEEFRKHFVKIAAHDIRSPLQNLQFISETVTPDHAEETSRDLQSEISRMDRLTRLLLDVSLFESGRIRLHTARFDLASLVESVVQRKHAHAGTVTFTNRKELFVRGDADRLAQVVTNLVENALKYSGVKKSVVVSVAKKGTHAVVSVSDSGTGISKADSKHLFDAFFRTRAAKRSTVAGSGLGLYIVKEIVRAHKGRIWVASKVGRGTTFSFSLPAIK